MLRCMKVPLSLVCRSLVVVLYIEMFRLDLKKTTYIQYRRLASATAPQPARVSRTLLRFVGPVFELCGCPDACRIATRVVTLDECDTRSDGLDVFLLDGMLAHKVPIGHV